MKDLWAELTENSNAVEAKTYACWFSNPKCYSSFMVVKQ
ncbi:hypothetical protein J2X61_004189 [Bacillus sp. 3255]|nr:hypothetical protein [Bacillus sp. 3255]